jgi:glycerol-3-phosphate O-acyltransferase / dihydroxyacetone phosphate acyltransferase
MKYGKPIKLDKELIELYKIDQKKACDQLLKIISEKLHKETINYPDIESMKIIQQARRLYIPKDKSLNTEEYLEMIGRFSYVYLKVKDEEEIKSTSKEIMDYLNELETLGLKDRQLVDNEFVFNNQIELIFRSLFFIILLVCCIPGFILNLPITATAKLLSQKEAKKAKEGSLVKIEGKDVIASYKITIGLVFIPILYFVYSLIVFYYYSFFKSLLTFFIVLPFLSYASIRMIEEGIKLWKSSIPLFMSAFSTNGENSLKNRIKLLKEKRKELSIKIRNYAEKIVPNTPFYNDRIVNSYELYDEETI